MDWPTYVNSDQLIDWNANCGTIDSISNIIVHALTFKSESLIVSD